MEADQYLSRESGILHAAGAGAEFELLSCNTAFDLQFPYQTG